MRTCKNCLHIDACKQWYPKLPDMYHNWCEHFEQKFDARCEYDIIQVGATVSVIKHSSIFEGNMKDLAHSTKKELAHRIGEFLMEIGAVKIELPGYLPNAGKVLVKGTCSVAVKRMTVRVAESSDGHKEIRVAPMGEQEDA